MPFNERGENLKQDNGNSKDSIINSRKFVIFLLGHITSQIGMAITTFSLSWYILQLTGSPLQSGIMLALGFLPYIIMSFPAGVWADRMNRKTLMVISSVGRVALLASFPIAHAIDNVSLIQIYLVQILMSGLSAIFDTCSSAALPSIVEKSLLRKANGAFNSVSSITKMVGTGLAGLLIAFIGVINTIILDIVFCTITLLCLMTIKTSLSDHNFRKTKIKMWRDIREGISFLNNQKLIRILAYMTAGLNFAIQASSAVVLFRFKEELYLSSEIAGVLMVGISLGVFIGSVIADKVIGKKRIHSLIIFVFVIQAIGLLIIGNINILWMIFMAEIFIGIANAVWNVEIVSLRQKIIPSEYLGRVSSVTRSMSWISIPLGAVLGGIIAKNFGSSVVFEVGSLMLLIICVVGFIYLRGQKEREIQTEVETTI